jgi:cell division protein FtsB
MFSRIRSYFYDLPPVLKNKYTLSVVAFGVWMLFFDRYDMITQYRLKQQLRRLETEKRYYEAQLEEVNALRDKLFSNKKELEKFARENYFMKRDNEDVFVIEEK